MPSFSLSHICTPFSPTSLLVTQYMRLIIVQMFYRPIRNHAVRENDVSRGKHREERKASAVTVVTGNTGIIPSNSIHLQQAHTAGFIHCVCECVGVGVCMRESPLMVMVMCVRVCMIQTLSDAVEIGDQALRSHQIKAPTTTQHTFKHRMQHPFHTHCILLQSCTRKLQTDFFFF